MELTTYVIHDVPGLLVHASFFEAHHMCSSSSRKRAKLVSKNSISVGSESILGSGVARLNMDFLRRVIECLLHLVVPCCTLLYLVVPTSQEMPRFCDILGKQVFWAFLGQKASHRVLHVVLLLACWIALYDSHAYCYQSFKDENRAMPSFRKTSQRSWRLGFWCRSCKRKSQRIQPNGTQHKKYWEPWDNTNAQPFLLWKRHCKQSQTSKDFGVPQSAW